MSASTHPVRMKDCSARMCANRNKGKDWSEIRRSEFIYPSNVYDKNWTSSHLCLPNYEQSEDVGKESRPLSRERKHTNLLAAREREPQQRLEAVSSALFAFCFTQSGFAKKKVVGRPLLCGENIGQSGRGGLERWFFWPLFKVGLKEYFRNKLSAMLFFIFDSRLSLLFSLLVSSRMCVSARLFVSVLWSWSWSYLVLVLDLVLILIMVLALISWSLGWKRKLWLMSHAFLESLSWEYDWSNFFRLLHNLWKSRRLKKTVTSWYHHASEAIHLISNDVMSLLDRIEMCIVLVS